MSNEVKFVTNVNDNLSLTKNSFSSTYPDDDEEERNEFTESHSKLYSSDENNDKVNVNLALSSTLSFNTEDLQEYSLKQITIPNSANKILQSAFGNILSFSDNSKKTVSLQEANGSRSKPSRSTSTKKVKQPSISKDIEQCRTSKSDFLDLSGQDLHQLPTLKDLAHVRFLIIYSNKLTELPKGIGDMLALEHLIAHENNLQANGILDELRRCKKLKEVDLRKNRLEDLPAILFSLPKLKHLFASFNKLTCLKTEIGNAKFLTVLILSHNFLKTSLPSSLGQLAQLQTLDLSFNNLESIPDEIGQCILLRNLKLHHNRLSTLPNSIGQLTKLVNLTLKYNQLKCLPASLVNCTLLEEFNIESNKIDTLPDSLLSKLPNLKRIVLSRNNFSSVPEGGAEQFSHAHTVNLDHNRLDKIPVGLFSLAKNLHKLNLNDNEICSLIPTDIVMHWTRIVELDLGSNRLQNLPTEIGQLINLEVLRLPHNQLESLPSELCSLPALHFLDLESNHLEFLPDEMHGLLQLTELNVISNQLKTFPSSIGKLQNLKIIRAGDNCIGQLPPEIGNMLGLSELYLNDNEELDNIPVELSQCSSLRILNLERCPLRDLPNQVVSGGSAMIIYFLQQVILFRNSRAKEQS